jgi:DNA-directed RNA polymerase subunit RPC12/RpoP
MADSHDPPGVLAYKLTCPICHELDEWEVGDEPRRVACGYCGTEMTCPPRALVLQLRYRPPQRTPDEIGSYGLDPHSQAEVFGRGEATGFNLRIPCPQCGQAVGTRLEERSKRINCPECGCDVVVPSRDGTLLTLPLSQELATEVDDGETTGEPQSEPAALVRDQPVQRPSETLAADAHHSAVPPSPVTVLPLPAGGNVFDALARIRQVELAAPPLRTFFSGVFEFPWRRATLPRWGLQGFGLGLLAAWLVGTRWALAGMSGPGLGLVLGCFALPGIWIALWSLSYSAANFLAVVEATAAGAVQVDDWPEPNWREWMVQLLYLGFLAAFPGAVAWMLTLLAGVEPDQRPRLTLAILAGLYPIVLMSALEANSLWVPLSRRVAVSLVRSPLVWLVFYLLAAALLVLVGGLLWLVWTQQSLWLAVASGPALSALLLIGARLFGRLAWKISDIESRWSRKRRETEVEQGTLPSRPQPPR